MGGPGERNSEKREMEDLNSKNKQLINTNIPRQLHLDSGREGRKEGGRRKVQKLELSEEDKMEAEV